MRGDRSFAGATRNGSQVRAGGARSEETEKRLADLHVRTLEETLARQAAQIVALEKQLVEAKRQVQDIAVKAIEGASGSKALSHVNQIAMEQAKNRPQGNRTALSRICSETRRETEVRVEAFVRAFPPLL